MPEQDDCDNINQQRLLRDSEYARKNLLERQSQKRHEFEVFRRDNYDWQLLICNADYLKLESDLESRLVELRKQHPREIFDGNLINRDSVASDLRRQLKRMMDAAGIRIQNYDDMIWNMVDTPEHFSRWVNRCGLPRWNGMDGTMIAEAFSRATWLAQAYRHLPAPPEPPAALAGDDHGRAYLLTLRDWANTAKPGGTSATEQGNSAAVQNKARADELAKIKGDMLALFGEQDIHKRGIALEGVINQLFAWGGIAVCEAFILRMENGKPFEQVDGVIEIDGWLYLVEMKWWKEAIGAPEVREHISQLTLRGGQVRGIFISYSKFTDPAIETCRDAYASGAVVTLCQLEELIELMEKQGDLKAMLKAKVNASLLHKQPLFAVPI